MTYFISGTDTNVGKTIVSALLLIHARAQGQHAGYYKPIQTGIEEDDDAATVEMLSKVKGTTGIALPKPLSPHLSAHYANTRINISDVVEGTRAAVNAGATYVEGVGGLLVPINDRYLMMDVIKLLDMPCILVVRSTLGTINHSLLSIEALHNRRVPLHGVVMVGPLNSDNCHSVKWYGHVTNILEVPLFDVVDEKTLSSWQQQNQQQIAQFLERT